MNSVATNIKLIDCMNGRADGWGHAQGREVHLRLLQIIDAHPQQLVFPISLEGIKRTDASFPRESVCHLAARYRGKIGFCLRDIDDVDLLENWDAAARKTGQPLIYWNGARGNLLGPEPSAGLSDLFGLVMTVPSITASKAAEILNLKLTNVSTKLKQLLEEGYILRREELAPSGGIEYCYFRIK